MVTEKSVEEFLKGASRNGAVLGSIGAGSMPLIRAGLLHGKNCTGGPDRQLYVEKDREFQCGGGCKRRKDCNSAFYC